MNKRACILDVRIRVPPVVLGPAAAAVAAVPVVAALVAVAAAVAVGGGGDASFAINKHLFD